MLRVRAGRFVRLYLVKKTNRRRELARPAVFLRANAMEQHKKCTSGLHHLKDGRYRSTVAGESYSYIDVRCALQALNSSASGHGTALGPWCGTTGLFFAILRGA
jgi:hypothetical protein